MELSHVTQTTIRQFIFFMKFISDHDLWDEAEEHLRQGGCTELLVSGEPIVALRQMVEKKLSTDASFSGKALKQARIIADCGCGVSPPGPPGGPPKVPEPPPDPPDGGGDLIFVRRLSKL